MDVHCPECGWAESETVKKSKWRPRGTRSTFEKRSCMECNHKFWVEYWKEKFTDSPYSLQETICRIVDTSVVEGLKSKYPDALPSSDQLRNFWGVVK